VPVKSSVESEETNSLIAQPSEPIELNVPITEGKKDKLGEMYSESELQTNNLSKSDIIKKFNLIEERIQQVIPDSIIIKLTTEVLLDSLINMKSKWGALFSYSPDNLITFSKSPFFYNTTYELINRHDFCSMYIVQFEKLVADSTSTGLKFLPLDLLISHYFIWNKFSDSQKNKIIEMILKRKKTGYRKSLDLLIVKILEFENVFMIATKEDNYIDELDIYNAGGIDEMAKKLSLFLRSREVKHEKY